MFGYVSVDKPNIRMKDFALYRAHYCGLCKSIGKKTCSQCMRFTVNYDIAFLSLVAHNYAKLTPAIKEERCIAHPLGRKFPVVQNNRVQEKIVDVNTVLGYYKVNDDVLDGGGLKYRLARAFLRPKFRKAEARTGELSKAVAEHYRALRKLEEGRCQNVDLLAETFAGTMVAIARETLDRCDGIAEEMFFHLGKWIYMIDAYDDLERDRKQQKFNPYLLAEAERGKESVAETARFAMLEEIDKIVKAYDGMDITVSEGPLSNIIYLGLRQRTETVLDRRDQKCRRTLL